MKRVDDAVYSFAAIFDVANKLQVLGDRHLEKTGFTTKQWFLTLLISLEEEPPSIGRCAELMGSSHQNIKQMVNKLVKLGMLRVTPDKKDKRYLRVGLTQACEDFWQVRTDFDKKRILELFSALSSDELNCLAKSLDKLRTSFGKELEVNK